jgi:hypothetical protein
MGASEKTRQYDVGQIGYVFRTDDGWIAKLYNDPRHWGPFATKREAISEVKTQAA